MKFLPLLFATTFLLANPTANATEGPFLSITMSELNKALESYSIEVRYPMWLLFNTEGQLVDVVQDDKESGYRSLSFSSNDWSPTSHPGEPTLSDFPAEFSTPATSYNAAYLFVIDHPLCSACADELKNLQALKNETEDSIQFLVVTVEFK